MRERQEMQLAQQLQAMKDTCASLCAKANSDASLESKGAYCTKTFTEGFDVTQNGLTVDYTYNLLPTIGVCEDRIYCPLAYDCQVGGSKALTMQKCREILCEYWGGLGFTAAQKQEKLRQFIQPGKCYSNADVNQVKDHWYTMLFDSSKNGVVEPEEITCQ
ncbi:MAG: hypothetical protein NT067_02885 [Candidatus Diapherotrites archaeon]|nr:hypothetical protein [Candidatus Diapherotrites archaeon]